jgi:hypothetical protein
MKLKKLSALAELVSAIAIVVTLGYLAIQTQQNTAAVQAGVRQAILESEMVLIRQLVDYPIVFTGRSGDADLTDEELVRLHANLLVLARTRENQWLQYQNGVIDETSWSTYQTAIPAVLSTDFMRSWWRNRTARGEFDEGFVAAVDKLLDANPTRPNQPVRETLGFDPP